MTFFKIFYQFKSETGDTGRKGYVSYPVQSAAKAMRRFFAEHGGEKDRAGNIITPIAIAECKCRKGGYIYDV